MSSEDRDVSRPYAIDVEREFALCIRSISGVPTQELLGSSLDFENADYAFPDDRIVAELKCLTEDKGTSRAIVARTSELYEKCLQSGDAPVLVFGTRRVTTEGFPADFTRGILELYRRPIRQRIKRANRQIRDTRTALGWEDCRGLLLLVNEGHTFLDPDHLLWLVDKTFISNSFREIDTTVIFSVNLHTTHPAFTTNYNVWMPLSRSPERRCADAFLERLQTAWFSHLNALVGRPLDVVEVDQDFIGSLTNRPRR